MTPTSRHTLHDEFHHLSVSALLDNLPFGIVLLRDDGSITWSNLEGARLLGRPQAALSGQSFPDIWAALTDSDTSSQVLDRLKSVAASREPTVRATVRLRIGIAGETPVEWTCHALDHDGRSNAPNLAISLRDLSREEELRAERDRLAAIAEESPSPVVELDRDGTMLYANPAMTARLAALGYRSNGTPAVLPPNLPDLVAHALRSGEPLQGVNVSLPDANFSWILCPVATHGLVRGYGIDVTNIRKAQQELMLTAQELRDANHRLDEALTVAQDAAKAKATFLAMMSHEIRTPMNGVIGMTSLLLETPLSPEQKTYATTIRQCGESLLRVINDVLEYSKIEAGKLELESIDFNLRDTVEDTLAQFAQQADAKGLELTGLVHANVPIALRGDPARLRQVLTNLIGNAVKFTQQGEVSLQVFLEEDSPDHATIRFDVTDSGIGIPPDTQAKLFRPFVQGDSSTTRRYGGTGLGLTISKQLIELMGGRITLISSVGQGSTFRFTARFAKQADSPRAIVPSDDLAGHRVLIVDDHESGRRVLRELISGWGMLAETVEDADAALRRFAETATSGTPFELVIADVIMPRKDGLQFVRELRQRAEGRTTPVVLLTPLLQRDYTERGQSVGPVGYLQKPIRHNQLQECLRKALARGSESPARHPIRPGSSSTESAPAVHASRRVSLLIVEDNEINQKLAARMAQKLGYDFRLANNGQEALDALAEKTYDAILMDCQMPILDGFETTKIIRQREADAGTAADATAGGTHKAGASRPRRIPIIAVTANAMKGDREQCLAAGMDDYLAKPIQLETLRSVLDRWIPRPALSPDRIDKRPIVNHVDADTFDLADLEANLGGDHRLIRELVVLFMDRHQTRLAEIKTGLETGDATTVERAAHTLKGAAGNLRAGQVASVAGRIEELARQKRLEEVRPLVTELEAAVLQLVPVLRQYHEETSTFRQAA
ncbi:MAG: response regulator [Nitrospira sp.]|nr:response regulator [Nitrospira sp.]